MAGGQSVASPALTHLPLTAGDAPEVEKPSNTPNGCLRTPVPVKAEHGKGDAPATSNTPQKTTVRCRKEGDQPRYEAMFSSGCVLS